MENTTVVKLYEEFRATPSFENLIEILFKVKRRGSTVSREVTCGFIHFLSTAVVLAVNPTQLFDGGYEKSKVACGTALVCALTNVLVGIIGNVPFVATPTLATSIYLSQGMKKSHESIALGNMSVFLAGAMLLLCSMRPLSNAIRSVLPGSMRMGICIGLSLLVALRALEHLGIVIPGHDTLLDMGNLWRAEVVIAMITFIAIGVMLHYEVSGAYVIGLYFGSLLYWFVAASWPKQMVAPFEVYTTIDVSGILDVQVWHCALDLVIIAIVLLAGLSTNLASLAGIDSAHQGEPPRSRWLFFACGVGTIVGSVMGTGPVLINAESAIGIKAGARTGLSTVVCGFLFALSTIFYPVWSAIPLAGVVPVLLMISVLLFENTGRVRWEDMSDALVVYITAIFSAFTYSIFHGVIFGAAVYCTMKLFTGDHVSYIVQRSSTRIPDGNGLESAPLKVTTSLESIVCDINNIEEEEEPVVISYQQSVKHFNSPGKYSN